MPLVILLFGAIWMFPLITALVAGDIFASEDHNGTLKTIFTRSLERGQIFAGKALAAATYAVAAILLSGTVAVVAGSIQSGFNSLQSLSGTTVSAPKALELVYVSLLVYLIPIAAIVCIGLLLSSITRNSAAAVVGTLMVSLLIQLIGILPGPERAAPVPAEHAVQRLAGTAAHADRLGADRPRGVGVRAVRGAGARRGATSCSCAATSPVAEPAARAERVLVVDDDPPLRRMLERTLVAEGFEVTLAADGGAALVAAERSAPDVIVLDVAMPVLDGLAVCRRLRSKGLPTPILMLTARDAVARSGGRTRGRRRRLSGQAVRGAGADRADPGADAAAGRPRLDALLRRPDARHRGAQGHPRRASDRADRARGGAARAAAARARPHASRASARSTRSGAAPPSRTSSTATSRGCGASSASRR